MIVILLSLTILGTVQASVNEWIAIGPEGADIAAVVIDPQNSKTVFALPQSGVYKSTDGGAIWLRTGFTGHANSLTVDPRNCSTIFLATSTGVSKSADGGASWSDASSGLPHAPFMQLVVDPTDSLVVYAWTYLLGPALLGPAGPTVAPTLFKSIDGGASWKAATLGLAPPAYALTLAIDPKTPGTVYLGTASAPFVDMHGGLYKSIDGAANWSTTELGVTKCCAGSMAIDPHNSSIYASWAAGIYKSIDSGKSWMEVGTGLPGMTGTLALDPLSALYVLTSAGLFKTMDSGANWTPVYADGSIRSFAIDPQNSGTIYAKLATPGQNDGGVFKTADGGTTWNETDSGLPSDPILSLAVDPKNQGTLYAANGGRLFKTTDAGAHWVRDSVNASKVVVDPVDSSVVYTLPLPGGNPAKSMDGGLTWSTLNPGLPLGDFVRDLVVDPADSGRLFLVTAREGVLKSVDQGLTWSSATSGLPAADVSVLAISASDPLTLYAGTADDCDDCEYSGEGVFKSIDGGASWTAISSGLPGGAIFLVTVDPQDSDTVYVGEYYSDTSTLFKTVDGGATWDRLNSGLDGTYAGSLAVDPHNPSVLYVGTGKGVFRSTDGGENWNAANLGLPDGSVGTVVIEPQDSRTVYSAGEAGLFVVTFTP